MDLRALPTHPSVRVSAVLAVCQMSIDRKCDWLGFGYPTPWTTHRALSSSRPARPSSDGWRPIESLTFLTWSAGTLIAGRYLAYNSSLNGMTVLRPSFPPVSWTTTRMVSLAPSFAASGAARAVRARNVGTVAPSPTRDDTFRNSRRLVMSDP